MPKPRQLSRLWGQAKASLELFAQIEAIAPTEHPVVIQGETGTGKELVAEALCEHSKVKDEAYVVVDCASIAKDLIESELFGHVRGAFTGALQDRKGAFEAADGGTIFIDELGELPLLLQPRLLRVLETGEVKRVGDTKTKKVRFRVIAATHRELDDEVRAGRFREDLYHRLSVFTLRVPPLRERKADIALLARRFLQPFEQGGAEITLSAATLSRLEQYDWPGNVRELRNIIERGAALGDRQLRLPKDFAKAPSAVKTRPSRAETRPDAPEKTGHETSLSRPLWAGKGYREAKEAVLADFERHYLAELMAKHGGHVTRAAEDAGIHRNILHRLLRRYASDGD